MNFSGDVVDKRSWPPPTPSLDKPPCGKIASSRVRALNELPSAACGQLDALQPPLCVLALVLLLAAAVDRLARLNRSLDRLSVAPGQVPRPLAGGPLV